MVSSEIELRSQDIMQMGLNVCKTSINDALVALEQQDHSKFIQAIAAMTDIISELYLGLDLENSGQSAVNLSIIYSAMLKHLNRAQHTKEDIYLRHCQTLLNKLSERFSVPILRKEVFPLSPFGPQKMSQ